MGPSFPHQPSSWYDDNDLTYAKVPDSTPAGIATAPGRCQRPRDLLSAGLKQRSRNRSRPRGASSGSSTSLTALHARAGRGSIDTVRLMLPGRAPDVRQGTADVAARRVSIGAREKWCLSRCRPQLDGKLFLAAERRVSHRDRTLASGPTVRVESPRPQGRSPLGNRGPMRGPGMSERKADRRRAQQRIPPPRNRFRAAGARAAADAERRSSSRPRRRRYHSNIVSAPTLAGFAHPSTPAALLALLPSAYVEGSRPVHHSLAGEGLALARGAVPVDRPGDRRGRDGLLSAELPAGLAASCRSARTMCRGAGLPGGVAHRG